MRALYTSRGTGPREKETCRSDGDKPVAVMEKNGFSLIEALAAVAILGVGMLGVAAMMHMSMDSDRLNSRKRIAYREANATVEQIKSRPTDPNNWWLPGLPNPGPFAVGWVGTWYYGAYVADPAQAWSEGKRPGDWLRRDVDVRNEPKLKLRQVTVDMFVSAAGATDLENAVGSSRFRRYTAVSYVK